jgi:predicted TIM-barrel fold metal-dependent hydrolase
VTVVDCDTHLFEPRTMWVDYGAPADEALRIADDELGWSWLTWRDRRIELAEVFTPGSSDAAGRDRRRLRNGEPPEGHYEDLLPPAYTDPSARVAQLDAMGLERSVVFPNFGLVWERFLAADLAATTANMAAWNAWAVDVRAEGSGRLDPVAHVTLRDLGWLEEQLRVLSAGGVRLAMMAPSLVDGRRLSHPDLDRAWSLFVEHGVTPVFHVGAFELPYGPSWYEDDPDRVNPVMSSVFLWSAPALAIADLVLRGVFERHPELRLGVMELSAVWVPLFLLMLDGGHDFHRRFNDQSLVDLRKRPSQYVRDHIRIAAFSYEQPDRLIDQAGDLFMFCSDYPHAEGTATPREDYARSCPGAADPDAAPNLYGGNIEWLLRENS